MPTYVADLKPRGVKPPMWLLPYKPLRAIVGAMHDGAAKYAVNNWRSQNDTNDWRETYTAALQRHVGEFADPDYPDVAEDSGIHHIAHAGACVLILLYHLGVDYVESNAVRKLRRETGKLWRTGEEKAASSGPTPEV